ncbi:restriction endonuclease subunit S [Providencia hangzhouensis]|uniref:restriction endonuclease subunit S n=2 Tax=Enterobacterales TaxID=91347 RepID=UPI002024E397|nr:MULTISPECIES: restriction endonuclease subunit S [Morganellaceae]MCL8609907.1 restriction endonuclease subunit S [Proteus mirabilis]
MSEFTEWKSLRFKDICRLKSDKITVDSSDIQTYISTENMLPNFGGVQSAKNIPLTGKLNTFKYGEVLFSNIRTYFKKVWIATFDGVASPDVLIFSAMKNCESQYLYYMMCEPQFTEFTVLTSRGAKMPRGDKEAILNYEISLPSLAEQKAIASVLCSLDDKIDLLHRQNKTLELMAETLFRQCFVEEAQDDWVHGTLKDEFAFTMGQSPKGSSFNEERIGTPMFQGNADFGFRFPKERVYTTEPTRFAQKLDTLISVRAPVGAQNMARSKCCIGRGVAAFRHIDNLDWYTYTYFKLRYLMDEIKKFNDEGTVFGSISKSDFEKIEVIIPPASIIHNYEIMVKPLNDRVITNCFQIEKLENLRDTLLPKLMSGEVRVKYTPEEIKQ